MAPTQNRRGTQARRPAPAQRGAWHPVPIAEKKAAAAPAPKVAEEGLTHSLAEESDSASTDQGLPRSTTGSASLSNSSSAESLPTAAEQAAVSRNAMLRVRDALVEAKVLTRKAKPPVQPQTPTKAAWAARRSTEKPSALASPPQSPASTCASASEELTSSPTSWAMQQKLRRQASGEAKNDTPAEGPVSDAEMRRRVKSVLNKLTPEKFNKLLAQMMECGACTPSHFDTIAQALFQEASMQHSFAGMYADLCACLVVNFGEGGCFLGNALLNQCWEQFRESLQPAPEASNDEDPEVAEEARATRRKRAIGNAKFMGELFVRDMLFAPELFTCTSMLLKPPLNTIALECLCTLLTVVGPFFDLPGWELHAQLMEVFWQIRGLTFDPSLSKRVKCLFRDVLDLREAGWVDNKTATKVDRPKRLEEVRAEWLLKEAAELKKQQELAKGQKKAARQHSGQWTPSTPGGWSSRSPAGSSNWSPLPSPMQTPKMTPKPSPKQSPKMSPTAATFKPMSPMASSKMMFASGTQLPMAAMPAQAWNAEGGAVPMVAVPVVFVPMGC